MAPYNNDKPNQSKPNINFNINFNGTMILLLGLSLVISTTEELLPPLCENTWQSHHIECLFMAPLSPYFTRWGLLHLYKNRLTCFKEQVPRPLVFHEWIFQSGIDVDMVWCFLWVLPRLFIHDLYTCESISSSQPITKSWNIVVAVTRCAHLRRK